MFPRVVVNSFCTSSGGISQLTEALSTKFSEQLSGKLGTDPVINHEALIERTNVSLLTPFDLQEPDVAMWLAEKVGANAIVFGTVDAVSDRLAVHVRALRLSDRKLLAESVGTITLSPDWQELLDKALPWATKPRLAIGCSSSDSKRTKAAIKEAAVVMPKCVHCPDPSYTDDARRSKFQGRILVSAIIDEGGNVIPLRVLEPSPPDLVDEVLRVYRSWKLQPATRDGKPVAVCVPIESSFKLF